MLNSTMLAAALATCPTWCSSEECDDEGVHANIELPPVEVTDLVTGEHGIVCVDISQSDTDAEPRIAIHSPLFDDLKLSADDVERLAYAMLAQVALVRASR